MDIGKFVNSLGSQVRQVDFSSEALEGFIQKNGPSQGVSFLKNVNHHFLGNCLLSFDVLAFFDKSVSEDSLGRKYVMFYEPQKVKFYGFELTAPWYERGKYRVATVSFVQSKDSITYAEENTLANVLPSEMKGGIVGPFQPFGIRSGLFGVEAYRLILPVFKADYSKPEPDEFIASRDERNERDY